MRPRSAPSWRPASAPALSTPAKRAFVAARLRSRPPHAREARLRGGPPPLPPCPRPRSAPSWRPASAPALPTPAKRAFVPARLRSRPVHAREARLRGGPPPLPPCPRPRSAPSCRPASAPRPVHAREARLRVGGWWWALLPAAAAPAFPTREGALRLGRPGGLPYRVIRHQSGGLGAAAGGNHLASLRCEGRHLWTGGRRFFG